MKLNIKGAEVNFGDAPQWRKSKKSGPYTDNCVEVASGPDGYMAVRDSKNPTGPVLGFTSAEWDAFVGGVKDGEFDR